MDLNIISTSIGLGGISLAVIAWIRYRKKDSADVNKTNAESSKLLAEASETKAKAEITIADAAMKLAERLGIECDATKKEIIVLEDELNQSQKAVRTLQYDNDRLKIENEHQKSKIDLLQQKLDMEIISCKHVKDELERLKLQLKNIQDGR